MDLLKDVLLPTIRKQMVQKDVQPKKNQNGRYKLTFNKIHVSLLTINEHVVL